MPEFKNNVLKNKAWDEVASVCDTSREEVQRKYKALREKYGREKHKRMLEERSGSGASNRSVWPYYEHLWFLDNFMAARK